MKRVCLALLYFLYVCTFCGYCEENLKELERIQEIVRNQYLQPLDEYVIYHAPSLPRKVNAAIPEWAPAQYLALSIPDEIGFEDERLLTFYLTIVKNAVRVVDVVLFVDERNLYAIKNLLSHLEEWKLTPYLNRNAPHRIHIITSRIDTKWIRDYGPVFLWDAEEKLTLVDAVYRDMRTIKEENRTFLDYLSPSFWDLLGQSIESTAVGDERNNDDTSAMYLFGFLHRLFGNEIYTMRPPLILPGGDFFSDGLGNLFTSYETLYLNGGYRSDLELILKHYYGMKNLLYLEPLPGSTIKHIDMIFKPVNPEVFLAAEYRQQTPRNDIYMQYLQEETKDILDRNIDRLKHSFPKRRIIRMPMPPLKRSYKLDEFAIEQTLECFDQLGEVPPCSLIDEPGKWNLEKFVTFYFLFKKIENNQDLEDIDLFLRKPNQTSRKIELDDLTILTEIVEKLIHDDSTFLQRLAIRYNPDWHDLKIKLTPSDVYSYFMRDLIIEGSKEDPDNYDYIFRSYLNSVYINGTSGRMLLVPSYDGCATLEQEVESIYRSAYPDTEIVFINSDAIIQEFGAIHCVALTVPSLR